MSAASTATSDPVPMAKLTSAAAGGRVVDAVADHAGHLASRRRLAHSRGLVGRQHIGAKIIDADLGCDGGRYLAVVAGQHQHIDTRGLRACNRLRRSRSHVIGQRDRSDDPAVGCDPDQCVADAVQSPRVRRRDAVFGQEAERPRDHDDLTPGDVDVPSGSLAGDRLEARSGNGTMPSRVAASRIALARGCVDPCSTLAASSSTCERVAPSSAMTPATRACLRSRCLSCR
jgi:hypothetical protein